MPACGLRPSPRRLVAQVEVIDHGHLGGAGADEARRGGGRLPRRVQVIGGGFAHVPFRTQHRLQLWPMLMTSSAMHLSRSRPARGRAHGRVEDVLDRLLDALRRDAVGPSFASDLLLTRAAAVGLGDGALHASRSCCRRPEMTFTVDVAQRGRWSGSAKSRCAESLHIGVEDRDSAHSGMRSRPSLASG